VKRSGLRDEPMWVAIHKCMKAMLRLSLYSYLYLKVAKNAMYFLLSPVLSSTKLEKKRAEQVLPGSLVNWWRRGRWPKQCIHM
jgi:hypothetical protein